MNVYGIVIIIRCMDSFSFGVAAYNRKIDILVIIFIDTMANTTISISKEFQNWLKGKGKKGESYENIIKSLLKPEVLKDLNIPGEVPVAKKAAAKETAAAKKPDTNE